MALSAGSAMSVESDDVLAHEPLWTHPPTLQVVDSGYGPRPAISLDVLRSCARSSHTEWLAGPGTPHRIRDRSVVEDGQVANVALDHNVPSSTTCLDGALVPFDPHDLEACGLETRGRPACAREKFDQVHGFPGEAKR